jgi:hypothetical protein
MPPLPLGESTILRFRHFLEEFGLTGIIFTEVNAILQFKGVLLIGGTAVDATLIVAPRGALDPEVHQARGTEVSTTLDYRPASAAMPVPDWFTPW